MNYNTDTIVAAKVVQNSQVKTGSVSVVQQKTMSTAALAVGLSLVFLGLVGVIVVAKYLNEKYKK